MLDKLVFAWIFKHRNSLLKGIHNFVHLNLAIALFLALLVFVSGIEPGTEDEVRPSFYNLCYNFSLPMYTECLYSSSCFITLLFHYCIHLDVMWGSYAVLSTGKSIQHWSGWKKTVLLLLGMGWIGKYCTCGHSSFCWYCCRSASSYCCHCYWNSSYTLWNQRLVRQLVLMYMSYVRMNITQLLGINQWGNDMGICCTNVGDYHSM